MLGDLSSISETKFLTRKKEDLANNKIINCTFEYADGVGLKMTGKQITVENNYIHDIDFSCITGGYTIDMSGASDVKFKRNTVHTGGGSEMYKAGPRHEIAYNNLSQSGHLQNDGSLIQVSVAAQPDSEHTIIGFTTRSNKDCVLIIKIHQAHLGVNAVPCIIK